MYKPKKESNRYDMYIFDISYFSGKLEAYFKYKEIQYNRIEVTWWTLASKIVQKTGLMEVPVIYDKKENIWLSDTSPLIEYFEKNLIKNTNNLRKATNELNFYKPLPILPKCNVQLFFSYLIGDFADEWLWKPAIYYRWSKKPDYILYGHRFVNEFYFNPFLPKWITSKLCRLRMVRGYVKKDGIINSKTSNHTEDLYLHTLSILENHFQQYSYMLGDSPCFIDFCLFASMFRHFSIDPTPAKIMRQQAPGVYEWVARMWNAKESNICKQSKGSLITSKGTIPESWKELLPLVKQYLIYLKENTKANKNGKKTFSFTIDDVLYKNVEVVPYRSWRREKLQKRYHESDEYSQEIIENILKEYNCWNDFIEEPWKTNLYNNKPEPPFTQGLSNQNTMIKKIRLFLTGTPRHQNSFIVSPLLIILILLLFMIIICLLYWIIQIVLY